MKKRYLLSLVVLLGLGILWALRVQVRQHILPVPAPDASRSQQQQPTPETGASGITQQQQRQSETAVARALTHSDAVAAYVQNKMADPQYDWKQRIDFYGKVVDESNRALAGASAHFCWTDLSQNGTSEADARSDSGGFFSLLDRRGKSMSITVSKEGYYTFPSERLSSFEYANPADGLFTPDANTPVIFHLRKKGVGVELITSQYGMSPDFPIHIPRDGSPIRVDFMQRKVGDSGQMVVSEVKPDYANWKQATAWSFTIDIPGGGFAEEGDEFPFEAPESGYQSRIEFQFEKGSGNWAERIDKRYYIRFGEPPRYGRLQLKTSISNGGAILTYAINPDGSRYLEPR